MKSSILAGRAALILLCAGFASASVPQTLNYQGAYREGGIPVSGLRTMTFRLTSADGSVEHWTSGPASVTVSTGIFRAALSLPASINWGAITPYIEVSVGTTTLLPRDPVRSSIYAVHAATAELVAAGAITDASVAAGAAISPVKIAGTAMTLSQTETVTGSKTFNANLLMGSGSIGAAAAAGVAFSTHVFITGTGSFGIGTTIPAGPLHVRTVGQDALFVSPVNAFVGLGTVTPAERLEVKNGSIKLTGIGAGIVFADNTVMNSASLGSANAVTNAIDLLLQGDSDANGSGDILLRTGVSERLRVANNGFVGVGTAVPASKLHLALPSSRDLAFSANAGGAWLIGLPSGGNTSLVNDQAVNIHAGGDGSAVGGVAGNPHTGLGAALRLYGNDNAGAGSAELSASGGAGALILKTASAERARLSATGSMGLGTASPSARLHVSGGDLQVGDASASTISASGYVTLANLGAAPAGVPGRLYYDSASSKLRLNNGAGFVDIATGTIGGANPANMATTDTAQSVSGVKTFVSTLTVTGNAFSVGGSSFVVVGGSVGVNAGVTPSFMFQAGTANQLNVDSANGVGLGVAPAAGNSLTIGGAGGVGLGGSGNYNFNGTGNVNFTNGGADGVVVQGMKFTRSGGVTRVRDNAGTLIFSIK